MTAAVLFLVSLDRVTCYNCLVSGSGPASFSTKKPRSTSRQRERYRHGENANVDIDINDRAWTARYCVSTTHGLPSTLTVLRMLPSPAAILHSLVKATRNAGPGQGYQAVCLRNEDRCWFLMPLIFRTPACTPYRAIDSRTTQVGRPWEKGRIASTASSVKASFDDFIGPNLPT